MKSFKNVSAILIILIIFTSCNVKKEKIDHESDQLLTYSEYDGVLSFGTIKRIDRFPTVHVRPRTVDIWIPDGYSDDKKHRVLYMHDGQMLFDASTTWNKQEWMVDEILGSLMKKDSIESTIVVAIWNHSDIRHTDYYPKKPFEQLAQTLKDTIHANWKHYQKEHYKGIQSDNYLKFIVKDLKPYIDTHFSVHTSPEYTSIAGSSMGGLISMYALCEYPDIFGAAACLSTHWIGIMPIDDNPVPATFFNYMRANLPNSEKHKIYFDYGTETLDAYYLSYQTEVGQILKEKGFDENNAMNLKFEGHDHSENSWNQRFHIPVQFLLRK